MRFSAVHATATRRSYTLPSSPTRSISSSSSDFEFAIGSDDYQRSSTAAAVELTPADDLFYKGKLLPLQSTPRLSMVKSLFFAPSNSSASSSRHSTGSSSSSEAPIFREYAVESSFAADDLEEDDDDIIISEPMILNFTTSDQSGQSESQSQSTVGQRSARKSKSFTFAKISSVFKKEPLVNRGAGSGPLTRMSASSSSSARDVMRKYMKKVKPLYEKMARRQKVLEPESSSVRDKDDSGEVGMFSRNLVTDRNGRGVVMSCPGSIRSSPCHSGVLLSRTMVKRDSSEDELHSAIQGAIAHCKNSMLQYKS